MKRKRHVSRSVAACYAQAYGVDSPTVDEFSAWASDWFEEPDLDSAWRIYTKSKQCQCAPCQSGDPDNCYKCPACGRVHGVIIGCNPPTPDWAAGLKPLRRGLV